MTTKERFDITMEQEYTRIIKIEFRLLGIFLAKWNEAGRPFKILTIDGRTKDQRLVGIVVKYKERELNNAFWLVVMKEELGFKILNEEYEEINFNQ